MRTSESPARTFGMESQQLPTQSEVLKDEILAGSECTNNPTEEVPEPHDHGKNLIRHSQMRLMANSLILRVYDVLMTHRQCQLISAL
jgi:hypothetical protein